MSLSPKYLQQRWSTVHQGAQQAIEWINEVRPNALRLDNEADDLILSLRRIRNQAYRLGTVAAQPMTVGFFGLSQAGKSYLISTLAAGSNGKLETHLGGQRLDFLTHINPPGGGKEATGLVTRFSRTARPGSNEFPLELKLFTEIELVKLLANSFFNDFNPEKVQYRFDSLAITKRLLELDEQRQAQPVPGVSEDDVVSLWDYLKDNFPASLAALGKSYWTTAIELAPWLTVEDRSRLFSIFWGEIPELSAAYLELARTLATLENASRVFAPLEVLVRKSEGGLSQADSIMNVDMIERLGSDSDLQAHVRPFVGRKLRVPVEVSLAQLAVLTAELVFPLLEATAEPLFENVDLLDFPGYRGRLAVESIDDVRRAVNSDTASPVAQLLLRGKVAYLFERYTDSQEMNVLIVCTPANKQSDVTSVGPVLSRWIERTQGVDPQQRAQRKPGLLWAITMFDMRISADLDKEEDLLRIGWGNGGMMKMCMLERFGQYSWLQEWLPNRPFANTFLVRKPRMKVTFLDLDSNNLEIGITTSAAASLAMMRRTFRMDETVLRHIADPVEAWDAMMGLNDGGMQRMADYLRQVALPEVKLQRIGEQLDEAIHLIDNRLGRWCQRDGADAIEKKRQIARQIYRSLWPRRALFGELLWHMQLPEEHLRELYLRTHDEPLSTKTNIEADTSTEEETEETTDVALNLGHGLEDDEGFDLFGEVVPLNKPIKAKNNAAREATVSHSGSDAQFAQSVLREWISHLRHLPENQPLMTFLGFDQAAIEALIDEIIVAASRLGVQSELLRTLTGTEQVGTRREQLAGRQVLSAQTVLGNFIAWLGFTDPSQQPRPASRVVPGANLFQAPPTLADGELPQLPEKPVDYSRQYIGDWLVGLAQLAENNAGHSAGLEISAQQNQVLIQVLDGLHEAPDSAEAN